jgi:hypothetical protein
MIRLSLALILPALPAFAEIDLPALQTAATRFGTIAAIPVDMDGFDGWQLTFADAPVEGITDFLVDIRAVMPRPDGAAADWVLVSLANGGNGCPMAWVLVEVSAAGANPSDTFGTCSETVLDMRTDGDDLVLDLASFEASVEKVTFTYDGAILTETPVPRTNDGAVAAGPGPDVIRWVGQHPVTPFEDASERLRFAAILSEDQIYELASRVTVADVVAEADGYVIGKGFDPKAGGDITGLWGIRISDGAPFAIFRDAGAEPQIFGLTAADLPPAAQAFLKEGL